MLVILAMTTAVILPRFSQSFAGLSFSQAAATLMTDLRYASALAITQRQAVQVALVEGTPAGYQLFVKATPDAVDGIPLSGRFGRKRVLPRNASLAVELPDGQERHPAAVTFYPDGQADPSLLILRDAQHPAVTITVDEATGQVSEAQKNHGQ